MVKWKFNRKGAKFILNIFFLILKTIPALDDDEDDEDDDGHDIDLATDGKVTNKIS